MKYNVNEVREWSQKLIDRCMQYNSFRRLIQSKDVSFSDLTNDLPADIHFANGCTRAVLWTDARNFVLKFPWCEYKIDYCAGERLVFSEAYEAGLDDNFAWTEKVMDICVNGVQYPVYAMEFCEVNCEAMSDASSNYAYKQYLEDNGYEDDEDTRYKYWEYHDSDEDSDQEGMLYYASSIWGDEITKQVIDLLDRLNVNDCHAGNWGYTRDGRLVICDYAGYGHKVGERVDEDEDDEDDE